VWIYGVDGSGNPVKVLVDAVGNLQIDTVTSALPTGAATAAAQATALTELQAKLQTDDIAIVSPGYLPVVAPDGDRLISYKVAYKERIYEGDAAAGTVALVTDVVAAGDVRVISGIVCRDTSHAVTRIDLFLYAGTTWYSVGQLLAPSANEWLSWSGALYLAAGERIEAYFYGVTVHDLLYLDCVGFEMSAPS